MRVKSLNSKNAEIHFRVRAEQKQRYQQAAEAEGITVSEWLIRLAEEAVKRVKKPGV